MIDNNHRRSNIQNNQSACAARCYNNHLFCNTHVSGICRSNNDRAITSGGRDSLFSSNTAATNQQLQDLLAQFQQHQHLQLQELDISSILYESQQQQEQQEDSTSTKSSSQDELDLDWNLQELQRQNQSSKLPRVMWWILISKFALINIC